MNAEFFTAEGKEFEFREFYQMPPPVGVTPTHFLVGSSMVPASSLLLHDQECVTSWAVIREVVRDNTSVAEAVPVEIVQARDEWAPVPDAEPQFELPVLTPHGGLSDAERLVLRDAEE